MTFIPRSDICGERCCLFPAADLLPESPLSFAVVCPSSSCLFCLPIPRYHRVSKVSKQRLCLSPPRCLGLLFLEICCLCLAVAVSFVLSLLVSLTVSRGACLCPLSVAFSLCLCLALSLSLPLALSASVSLMQWLSSYLSVSLVMSNLPVMMSILLLCFFVSVYIHLSFRSGVLSVSLCLCLSLYLSLSLCFGIVDAFYQQWSAGLTVLPAELCPWLQETLPLLLLLLLLRSNSRGSIRLGAIMGPGFLESSGAGEEGIPGYPRPSSKP